MNAPAHHEMLTNITPYYQAGKLTNPKDANFIKDLLRLKNLDRLAQLTPPQAAWLMRIHFRHCGQYEGRFQAADIKNGTPQDVTQILTQRRTSNKAERMKRMENSKSFAKVAELARRKGRKND